MAEQADNRVAFEWKDQSYHTIYYKDRTWYASPSDPTVMPSLGGTWELRKGKLWLCEAGAYVECNPYWYEDLAEGQSALEQYLAREVLCE